MRQHACVLNVNKLSITFSFLIYIAREEKTIMVSGNGIDSADCGHSIPCRTVGFVLTHRAANNDVIVIETNELFTINRSFHVMRNITMIGTNGRPIIAGDNSMESTYLFQASKLLKEKLITLRIKNIIFRRMGILRLTNLVSDDNISFENCYFENAVTDKGIISIENSHSNVHAGLVHFRRCHFMYNVALQSSAVITIVKSQSVFYKCQFRNNLLTNRGLISFTDAFSVFENNYFKKNAPVSKYDVHIATGAFKLLLSEYNNTKYGYMTNSAGGVICATTNSTITVSNCSFIANEAIRFGGAIRMFGKKLVIKSSLFEHNAVMVGASFEAVGGAISAHSNSIVEIFRCSFKRNRATYAGGAINLEGSKIFIRSSLFEHNKVMSKYIAKTYGGAISSFSNSEVRTFNCLFNQNEAAYGGAVHTQGKIFTIKSSIFDHNAALKGGAFYILAFSFAKILNCSFQENEAMFLGGAIYASKANKATHFGSAAYMRVEKLRITFSSFIHNTVWGKYSAAAFGGAIFTKSCTVQILNCSFERNEAVKDNSSKVAGGAIFACASSVFEISNCFFRKNEAASCGGAIHFQGIKMVVRSSLFEGNRVINKYIAKTYGGAISLHSNIVVAIFNCLFKRNEAAYGGALNAQGKIFRIESSIFDHNAASVGGALHIFHFSFPEILNCSFQENEAMYLGGAIYAYKKNKTTRFEGSAYMRGEKLIIRFSSFKHNAVLGKFSAAAFGGAIFTKGCTVKILNCSFERNEAVINNSSATASGGAICACASSVLEISNCLFQRNEAAGFGGAIHLQGIKMIVKSSLFEGNKVINKYITKTYGGAILLNLNTVVAIFNCFFNQNEATYGGAIYTEGKIFTIKSSIFDCNSAVNDYTAKPEGGAIHAISFSFAEILKCSFSRNKAARLGGAICADGTKLIISSSSFEQNTAVDEYIGKTGAGAIYVNIHSIVEILNCSFIENKATYLGGSMLTQGKKVVIKSSVFDYNSAVNKYPGDASGGAISTSDNSDVEILNCSFKGNKATDSGGAVHIQGKKLIIKSSLFQNNTACGNHAACDEHKGFGGAISMNKKVHRLKISSFNNSNARSDTSEHLMNSSATCDIFNCSFQKNTAKQSGGAIVSTDIALTVNASSFKNNVGESGGAISSVFAYSASGVSILGCSFSSNKATISGGAVTFFGKKFQGNTVLGRKGEGGALYVNALVNHRGHGEADIFHSVFDGNQASLRGGAVMAALFQLTVRNSSFQSSFYPHSESYSGGDLLYSKSNVILENVTFLYADNYNSRNSLIFHENFLTFRNNDMIKRFDFIFFVKATVHIKCLTGKNIAVSSSTEKLPGLFAFISVSCSFCPVNFYSLQSSHLEILSQTNSIRRTNAKCYHCPLGGICEKGNIRASDNFWGYIFAKEVHFVSCPFGYCCFNDECLHYSSCHISRSGVLCSQCKKGFTENLLTPNCLLPEKCRHPGDLLIVIIIGIVYVSVLMFINEITKILNACLVPSYFLSYFKYINKAPFHISEICHHMKNVMKATFSHKFYQGRQIQYLTNEVLVEEVDDKEPCKNMLNDAEYVCNEEILRVVALQNFKNEEDIFPGLLKVIIFFYQTNLLFKVYTGSNSDSILHILQEGVSTLFNLRTDGTFTQALSWCPFDNLQRVSKILLKCSFIMYLHLLIMFAFLICRIGKLLNITGLESNHSRLFCCTLRLIFISYAGITTACFSLLSCVELGHHGKVLFIDGSIQCYKWWQLMIVGIVCCWIVPFPVTVYASSQLLHKNMLSAKQFLLCSFFPLPVICYWLFTCLKDSSRELSHREVLSQEVQDVLQIMEGPFRKVKKKYPISWESVLIGRRLVLIFIRTFVINTLLRLSLMLFCMILFLSHHICIKPFASKFLNKFEAVSLLMLTIICFVNLFPAYNYTFPTYSYDFIQGTIQKLKIIETSLNLVFPALVGLLITFLMFTRIFQFIFLVCCCFVRLIRFCIKYKLT